MANTPAKNNNAAIQCQTVQLLRCFGLLCGVRLLGGGKLGGMGCAARSSELLVAYAETEPEEQSSIEGESPGC